MADKEYSNEHPKYKKKHWTEIPAKGWNEVLKEDREFRKKLREKNINRYIVKTNRRNPMARKKKTRTVSDVIEDIRELHEKEEDLLMELEDLTEESDIGEGDE